MTFHLDSEFIGVHIVSQGAFMFTLGQLAIFFYFTVYLLRAIECIWVCCVFSMIDLSGYNLTSKQESCFTGIQLKKNKPFKLGGYLMSLVYSLNCVNIATI